jgi:hypothetical protein
MCLRASGLSAGATPAKIEIGRQRDRCRGTPADQQDEGDHQGSTDGGLSVTLQGCHRQHDADGDDDQCHADGAICRGDQRLQERMFRRNQPTHQAHCGAMQQQRQSCRRDEHRRCPQPVRYPRQVFVSLGQEVAKKHGDPTTPAGQKLPPS